MKIANEPRLIDFNKLNAGDVFWINGLGIYMKTETKGTCNAVNLSSGEFIECGYYCKVQAVDCELVINKALN